MLILEREMVEKILQETCLSPLDFHFHACVASILNSISVNISVIAELKWILF